MFTPHAAAGYTEPIPGIRMKTLTWGDKTLLTEFALEAGRELPMHRHPHEQIGYLVSGRMRLRIGEDRKSVV